MQNVDKLPCPWLKKSVCKACLGDKSQCLCKEKCLKNAFWGVLSWRGVQAGVPPPSHFSKVLAAFYKPGTVRGGLHKDIPAYPVPLVGNFRCLATECDSCRFSRPRPPCPPSQPAWEKGGLLGCTLGGPQVSPALLHVQGLGATGPH